MLKAGSGNGFEPKTITISAALDTGVDKYGDRVTITDSTIINDDALIKMAKNNLFNDEVLKECLKG
jgi:hypothetical protein